MRKEERIEIEDEFLTNVRQGERRPPRGESWVYFLLGWRIRRIRVRKRTGLVKYDKRVREVFQLGGRTKCLADQALARFVRQKQVTLLKPSAPR